MGRTVPRNDEAARRARELYVPRVFGYKAVARELGISVTSVRRYVDDNFHQRMLADSREAKKRRTGVCERCGGETRYNGRTTNGPSPICDTCAHTFTHCQNGHKYTPETDLRQQPSYKRGGGHSCRICRNDYMREFSRRRRREAGIPERNLSSYESRRLKLETR